MPIPCRHNPPGSVPGCAHCGLWRDNPFHRQRWGGPAELPAAARLERFRPLPCVHLGAPTGETRHCPACGGREKTAAVRACALHGACTEDRLVAGLACCRVCPDRAAAPAPAGAVTVDHGAAGIGDGLLGLLAVAGVKADRPDAHVVYRPGAGAVPFVRLFGGCDEVGVRRSKTPEQELPDGAVQLNAGYAHEFATGHAEPRWERYRRNAGASRCVVPAVRDPDGLRRAGGDLGGRVVLAPFSTEPAREWAVQHYRHLARLLREAGFRVAVAHSDPRRLRPFDGLAEPWADLPAERLTGAFLHAACVVGGDSGPAHLAGLLGVPTVVLGGYTPVQQIFGAYPRAVCLQGPLDCTGCCGRAPIDRRCRASCGALQLIPPERVAAAVREAVGG